MDNNISICVEHLSKKYRYGVIGSGSFVRDFNSWIAKLKGNPNPNLKIGEEYKNSSGSFWALDDINLTINKGERIGIIGGNGAGKSTLLKLICQITGPTKGEIGINGSITSMLEVGTGFHPELTGRENIYLNGAILGMTKKDVNSVLDQIIEFSECKEFIDTPVKRYSSGMYVKLAFSVSAHLKSDIVIMDEVLAVGDFAFQQKCLKKMESVSKDENKTILYVSHNMDTIRQLCTRCIVLQKGKLIFDGDVKEAIDIYTGSVNMAKLHYDFLPEIHNRRKITESLYMNSVDLVPNDQNDYLIGLNIDYNCNQDIDNVYFRLEVRSNETVRIGTMLSNNSFVAKKGKNNKVSLTMDISNLMLGMYRFDIVAFTIGQNNEAITLDGVHPSFYYYVEEKNNRKVRWNPFLWGSVQLNNLQIN